VSLGFLILLSLSLGLAAWLLFVWSVRSGQYDDPEGPKYRMLDDEDAEGPPQGRSQKPGGSPGSGGEKPAQSSSEGPRSGPRDRGT
jgi:cbb3-type cytochrome oxidase maturation protein